MSAALWHEMYFLKGPLPDNKALNLPSSHGLPTFQSKYNPAQNMHQLFRYRV